MAKKITKNVRLTNDILPTHYKIHLTPDLSEFVFTGEEEIQIEIKKPVSSFTIHSAEIEITQAELVRGKLTEAPKVKLSEKDEEATFIFQKSIPAGKYSLNLKFTGLLNDKMRGFYRSRYDLDGKTHHLGVTQFESTDARRAFPSFDEPAKKAVFEVSLTVPLDRTVISNTVEANIAEHDGGVKTVSFTPSPVMSSYLLAFVVGHFEHIEKKSNSGILVRVFTTPGKLHQAKFALETAVKCMDFYQEYFGIAYPLPTMDLIAIPDFAAGAMENWGAVTYRETAILVDDDLSSTANKQWVALVIAHELAHQWFGNLVTMEWWTHLWLNEGFASYMEYVAVDKLYPEWNIWSQFVFLDHSRALALDGLANTHPIEVEVSHPAEISEIFDAVSYSKGSSIIRMLAEYMGEVAFRKGIRSYLKTYKYSNAKTEDLWAALEKSSGKKVKKIMQAWTAKAGYPLITIKSNKGKTTLTQKRFFSNPVSAKSNKALDVWPIPLDIITPEKVSDYYVFDKSEHALPAGFSNQPFLKLNAGETSFVRVNYAELLEKLEVPLASKNKKLKPSDRFGIVRDAFALAEAGQNSTERALHLALSYTHEENYNVWAQITSDVSKVASLISDEKYYEQYANFAVRLYTQIRKHLTWEKAKGESHSHTMLRSMVLYASGTYGHEKTIERAKELFRKSHEGKGKIEGDLRGVVYNLVAENGGEHEYEIFRDMFRKAEFEEERDRILRALCLFHDEKLLSETLAMAFGHDMHGQDSVKAINFVFANKYGRNVAWEYLQKEWGGIVKKFGGGHLYTRFVEPLDCFTTKTKLAEIKKFFKDKDKTGIERTLAQVYEQIESNVEWLARDGQSLSHFLSQFK